MEAADETTPLTGGQSQHILADTYTQSFSITNSEQYHEFFNSVSAQKSRKYYSVVLGTFCAAMLTFMFLYPGLSSIYDIESAAWSSKAAPFSIVDPTTIGVIGIERPSISLPGKAFGNLVDKDIPLPTNTWFENFMLGPGDDENGNKVFQVPYILDTAGPIAGVRTHACHVQANDRMVMVSFYFFILFLDF